MKKPNITSETVKVTPEIAEEWYVLSGGNRPINRRHIDFLEKEMRTNWHLNGEAIIFDWNGKLIEGHHRLVTSAERGVSFVTLVIRGVDPAAKATINTGRSRTGSDALSYTGKSYTYTQALASTAARLLDHEAGRMTSPGAVKHSNAALCAKVDASPGLEDSIKAVHGIRNLVAVTQIAWLHYLLINEHPEEAAEFFEQLNTGLHLTATNPIYQLRLRLTNAKLNKRKIDLNEVCALLVKTWNAFFRKKPIRVLRWASGTEDFPKIEGL